MTFLSRRLSEVKPSPTLALAAKAAALKAQGQDIINFGVGEPDADTPQHIKDAAIQALLAGKTKYTPVEGILPLRQAIVDKLKRENQLDYQPGNIVVGVGAKQVIFNAFLATLNAGDEVIIPAPYWVSYPDMVQLAEGKPVFIECPAETHFKLKSQALAQAITPQTKWLILNSPSNPTGMVYNAQELLALAEVLRSHPQVHILCDDIYEHLVYDNERYVTLAQVAPFLKERILLVNGVSKSYSMTGWRIGYGAGPVPLIQAMTTIQSQSTSNAVTFAQEGAVAALQGPQTFIHSLKSQFQERRDLALKILNDIPGLTCVKPEGAFYFYLSCKGIIRKKTSAGVELKSDMAVTDYLLETAHVAAVPGVAFGLSPYFRISYALETSLLLQGCQRIKQALSQLL